MTSTNIYLHGVHEASQSLPAIGVHHIRSIAMKSSVERQLTRLQNMSFTGFVAECDSSTVRGLMDLSYVLLEMKH